jgi:hypothetical protein
VATQVLSDIDPFPVVDHELFSQLRGRLAAISFGIDHDQYHRYPLVTGILFQLIEVTYRRHLKKGIDKFNPVQVKIFPGNPREIQVLPFAVLYLLYQRLLGK